MERNKCFGVFFYIALGYLFSGVGNAATLALDLDPTISGVQSNRILYPGQILDYEVVFSGDNLTQFDTFALDLLYTSPLVVHESPVAGAIVERAPLMVLDLYSANVVTHGDRLTLGGMPVPIGIGGGIGGVGISSVGGAPFSLVGEGEAVGLFSGSLILEEGGILSLSGFPFGVGTELTLAGEVVPVTLQDSTVSFVPLPPAVWLFATGVLALLGSARDWRGGIIEHVKRWAGRWLLLVIGLAAPYYVLAADYDADLNGDVVVTSKDISLLASCFGQDPAISSVCTKADVDKDGDIDRDDFNFVSTRMGQAYPWMLYPMPDVLFSIGYNPTSFVAGDVNGDDLIDLITVHSSENTLSLFIGSGDGFFSERQSITVGDNPTRALLEDINGDGEKDLVVSNSGSEDVSVLLGNGDGSFQTQQRFAGGGHRVAVGDINGDGNVDIATISTDLSILLGNGDGTFQAGQRYPVGQQPIEVRLGDMDGDGRLDVVVANHQSDDLSILLGNGDGSVQVEQRYLINNPWGLLFKLTSMDLGDINGDGLLDVVATTHYSLVSLLGNGDGTLQEAEIIGTNNSPVSLALGDLDEDGDLDAVTLSELEAITDMDESITVWLGNGDGSFQLTETKHVGSVNVTAVTFSDANADGQLDIITNGSNGILIQLSGDDHIDLPLHSIASGTNVWISDMGDLNGDGIMDLLMGSDVYTSSIWSLLGSQEKQFHSPWGISLYAGGFHGGASGSLGDVNGDGLMDLIVKEVGSDFWGSCMLSVNLGNGDGSFQASSDDYTWGSFLSFQVADVNGDGSQDLVGGDRIVLSNGDGTLQAERYSSDLRLLSAEILRDLDGDGLADAIGFGGEGDILVMHGHGDGRFEERQRYSVFDDTSSFQLSDVNRDGVIDVLTFGGGRVGLLLGGRDGSFQEQRLAVARTLLSSAKTGDINGDGAVDLVGGHAGYMVFLLGKGDGSFHEQQIVTSTSPISPIKVEDFDGDGLTDLVLSVDCDPYNSTIERCISISYGGELNP